jgi:hypothetical protein
MKRLDRGKGPGARSAVFREEVDDDDPSPPRRRLDDGTVERAPVKVRRRMREKRDISMIGVGGCGA